ncbi:MAG: CCA tRNA nucleotidyltransferase [Planctomycetota bacterium]
MPQVNSTGDARLFALEVVQRLRAAGFEALWAGGCVRDSLLGIEPKDYDVATDARPEQVRNVFGRRQTIAVGASFGVITVLGPRHVQPVEVATFRCDGQYSDGRHPDQVTFSDAAADAQRRDFTINGLFFDPLAERVIDYVGGQDDLRAGVVRAIGDARARFDEDKLRMIRAVRFAATYDFSLESTTLTAIRELAGELVIVSAERIAAEMRRLLPHPRRRRAVELLRESELLPVILPEIRAVDPQSPTNPELPPEASWNRLLEELDLLVAPSFSVGMATLINDICRHDDGSRQIKLARDICRRWRLSNDEANRICWLLEHEETIRLALTTPWPKLQRILVHEGVTDLLTWSDALATVRDGNTNAVEHCRRQMGRPTHLWNPPPLLTGDDLQRAGLKPGPFFRPLLDQIRDQQLEGLLTSSEQALEFALRWNG